MIPALALLLAAAQEPAALTADEIMVKVAENQERAEQARSKYVYRQNLLGKMMKGGKLSREDRREYTITPEAKGFKRELVKFEGKHIKKGQTLVLKSPEEDCDDQGTGIDCEVLNDLMDDLMGAKDSKDGIDPDLFPLRKEKQGEYRYQLLKSEEVKGRKVHRIAFRPKDKDDFGWKGEALIDAEDYHPVSIQTKLSRGIPMAVKVLLGTNLSQLGFNVEYKRVAPGVWFPVAYGTEFHVRAVFFYSRTMILSMANSDFRVADVKSDIKYQTEQ